MTHPLERASREADEAIEAWREARIAYSVARADLLEARRAEATAARDLRDARARKDAAHAAYRDLYRQDHGPDANHARSESITETQDASDDDETDRKWPPGIAKFLDYLESYGRREA